MIEVKILRTLELRHDRLGQNRLAHLPGAAQQNHLPFKVFSELIVKITFHGDYYSSLCRLVKTNRQNPAFWTPRYSMKWAYS
jgi:hypothetical protein